MSGLTNHDITAAIELAINVNLGERRPLRSNDSSTLAALTDYIRTHIISGSIYEISDSM